MLRISFSRIWAVFLRYFYTQTNLTQIADLFYWPTVDLLIWGIATVWIQHENAAGQLPLFILTALVFWQIIWRGNYEVAVNLLQEFWNRNLVNIFSTPLKLGEWILGVMLMGVVKILVSLAFATLLVYILYALNVFTLGWAFLPFAFSLMISGWIMGLLASSLIIYWGQKIEMIAFMLAYLFAPFSAVFYPITALPVWAQKIAWSLPTTYVFEGMRTVLQKESFPLRYFLISLLLNAFYFVLTTLFFARMFEKSRRKGLARLE